MEWEVQSSNKLLDYYNAIVGDANRMQTGAEICTGKFGEEQRLDYFAKDFQTRMDVKDNKIYISTNYITWVNAQSQHPLKGN